MVRATHGAITGTWYYEIKVDTAEGFARVGLVSRKVVLDAPVGYDQYGFSYAGKTGELFHKAKGRKYGSPFGMIAS
jgi:hypothetical protein